MTLIRTRKSGFGLGDFVLNPDGSLARSCVVESAFNDQVECEYDGECESTYPASIRIVSRLTD